MAAKDDRCPYCSGSGTTEVEYVGEGYEGMPPSTRTESCSYCYGSGKASVRRTEMVLVGLFSVVFLVGIPVLFGRLYSAEPSLFGALIGLATALFFLIPMLSEC